MTRFITRSYQRAARAFSELLAPDPSIQNLECRRRMRLLAGLLLFLTPLTLIGALVVLRLHPLKGQTAALLFAGFVVFLAAYFLNRRKHDRLAVALTLGYLSFVPFASWYAKFDYRFEVFIYSFVWVFLTVLLGSLLLDVSGVVWLTLFNTAGMLALPVLVPGLAYEVVIMFVRVFLPIAVLIIAGNAIRQKDLVTIDRQSQKVLAGEAQLQRSYHLIAALGKVAARIQSTLAPEQIFETLERQLSALGINFYVCLLDPPNQELVIQYIAIGSKALQAAEKLAGMSAKGFRIKDENFPIYDGLIVQKKPQYIGEVWPLVEAMLPDFPAGLLRNIARLANIGTERSIIYLPLFTDEQVSGFLGLWGKDLREDDIPTFSVFAGQVASAIRTAELYKQAQIASQAKSEFLSRMSHELRTPLNAILGFAQLLVMNRKEPLTDSQRQHARQIIKGGEHLLDIINEVLDLARIEAGRMPISPEAVDLCQVVDETLEMVNPLAASSQISITVMERPAWPFVNADLQRLKQVLLNLISNAIKYNQPGGEVLLACEPVAEGWLRVSIRDTGWGIPADRLSQLFQPFERLGVEIGAIEGTGLGLALSKRLIELMGGRIGADSAPGQGSTFWFELPASQSPVAAVRRQTRAAPATAEISPAQTLLYIEDNASNYHLIREVLADQPRIQLLWAMRGEAGLQLAQQHRPDLILLDIHLPDLNGAEVLKRLQSAAPTRHIPVIVLSADATPGQINRLKQAGARDYLTKPLDIREFLQTIEKWLSGDLAK